MRRHAALLILATLAGCSERPRSNPFDPGNPATHGRPAGFVAIGDLGRVSLRWQRSTSTGEGVGFQVYRRVEGEIGFKPISSVLPASAIGYEDGGALDGVRHDYRVYYVLSGTPSGLPAEDWATPGPRRVWFADLSARAVSRLSSDGHRVAVTRTGYLGPTHVAFDATNRRLWISDTHQGRVESIDADGASRIAISGLTEPVELTVDVVRQQLWVCDQARDAVYHYRLDGTAAAPFSIGPINTPAGIAFDPNDGSLWICERGGFQVRRFSATGTPIEAIPLIAPSRVAVDSMTRDAWVTSFEGAAVFRITSDGTLADTVRLAGPIGIAVDWRNGRIWVADAVAGALVALRRSGVEEFRLTGLPQVREPAVDLATGECVATVPGMGAVVRVSPSGSLSVSLGGLAQPYGIVVEP